MKEKIKFLIAILLIVITMLVFINKKEGFHEDEMFSYGSSNYNYDNVYRQYGKRDEVNQFLVNNVFSSNIFETIKNLKYYFIDNTKEKDKLIEELAQNQQPIWRTSEEAKEYLSIQKQDILNYSMVYYNQSRDVHPPLFYFLVHTVSIIFYNNFSKYIIFIINISFLIASCYIIQKIMETLNKKLLAIPAILLYGLSMGAISTVIFQRMYMMLTFFTLAFLLINLKIIKNDYIIDKKTWIKLGLVTILGFLTQYYFCIIATIIAIIIFINIIKKKDKKQIKSYILNYIKIAIIGLIIFPMSIQHIFFSYRGVGSFNEKINYIEKLIQYMKLIGYSFSIPLILGIILMGIVSVIVIYKLYKRQNKHISEILILTLPTIVFILIIAKIAPNLGYKDILRYIMCILPIITIVFLLMIDEIVKNKKFYEIILITLAIIISINGIITSKPMFLYTGYNNYLQIAKENKEKCFVFIGNTTFNQIQSMPEFEIYNQSLILNETQINMLENDEKISNSNEFILSIKKYLGNEQILKEILEKTNFTNYEVLLDDEGETECVIYKIRR